MTERDGAGGPGLPDQRRIQLVVDLVQYLSTCEQALSQGSAPPPLLLRELQRQSSEIQQRAREVGHGGVAHHLERGSRLLASPGPLDMRGLRASLSDLSELAWQAKQELSPWDRAIVERSLQKPAHPAAPPTGPAGGDIAPPLMMTILPQKGAPPRGPPDLQGALPPASVAPPPLLPDDWSARSDSATGPKMSSPAPLGPSPMPPPEPHAPNLAVPKPSSVAQVERRDEPAPAAQQAPALAVRTMFGLRAFRRRGPEAEEAPKPQGEAVLGLRGFSRQGPTGQPPPPQMLSGSLPPLPAPREGASDAAPANEMENLLGRLGRNTDKRSRTPRSSEQPRSSERPRRTSGRSSPRRGSSGGAWWLGAAAVLVFAGLAVGLVVGWKRLRETPSDGRAAASARGLVTRPTSNIPSGAAAMTSDTAMAAPRTTDDPLRALLDRARSQGGKESPELRAWVDHQASMQEKLLATGKCEGSAAACSALFRARGDVEARGAIVAKKKAPSAPGALRPRWLAGLKMPDKFPVQDDPRVQRFFEKYTDTQVGRALVESMLFRCGSYRDRIQETLIRYELPQSLLAVVFAESGCDPLAKSPVGAEGLWQFMPEAGRAYHLHIIEDVIDERHSPPKSTEAAIHFLADLYKKFGSWDLVFAAYNMGPYGLMARLERAGGNDVGFWDLLDADLLPNETAQYVPIIEAFALILENLQRLKFAGTQMRSPEVTADLDAAPGTRLSLIARAAATSVNQLRLLNLDIKGENVPNIPGQLFPIQVPKDVVWQARDTLQDLTTHAAYEDQCVPPTFDWGKQRFTAEMEADCRGRFGGAPPARIGAPSPSR